MDSALLCLLFNVIGFRPGVMHAAAAAATDAVVIRGSANNEHFFFATRAAGK